MAAQPGPEPMMPLVAEHRPGLGTAKRVRVALLATSTEFGGIERVLLNLLQHMDGEVELVPVMFTRTDRETTFFERLRSLGIAHEKLYVNAVKPEVIASPLANLRQAIQIFRRERFDLVHSHGYRADIFGLIVARWVRIPLISTCHGFITTDSRLRLYNALDKLVLRSFTRVIAVSTKMRDDLIEHGLAAEKITVIKNAVPEISAGERANNRRSVRSRLGIGDGEFVFGYVGRLSEEKGLNHLLEAMRTNADQSPSSRLLLVGDGPRRAQLEEAVHTLGLRGRIEFAGFHSDTAPWYSAMDAFVLPSLTEGTPMALLEAMAHRVPVIASAVGGVPAVVRDGHTGLLVPPADPDALREALARVVADPELRARLAESAWHSVHAEFDVRNWIHQMREVYLSVLPPARQVA